MKARLATKSMLPDVMKELELLLSAKKARDEYRAASASRAQPPQRASDTQPVRAAVASTSQAAATGLGAAH